MLYTICSYLNNFFTLESDKKIGDYAITGGVVSPPLLAQEGQYYRIRGSVNNDGIYKHGEEELSDEPTFRGAIWYMRIPKAFLQLVKKIEDWQARYGSLDTKDGRIALSPYNSESFGGYSYSKNAASGTGENGTSGASWQGVFAAELNIWKKVKR